MAEDIDGAIEIEKRIQSISRGVLGEVLAADAAGYRGVVYDLKFQLQQTVIELGLRLAKPSHPHLTARY